MKIFKLFNIANISCGSVSCHGIKNVTIWAVGYNKSQFGLGDTINRNTFIEVNFNID